MAEVAGYYCHRSVYRVHDWEDFGLDVPGEAFAFVAFSHFPFSFAQ